MDMVRILRKERKMTQCQLAQLLGASQGSVAMWETGKALPSTKMLRKLAKVFGVTIDQLLNEKENV